LLYARIGRTFCGACGAEIRKDTVDEVADRMMALPEGTRLQVFFPLQPPPAPPQPEKIKARRTAKKKAVVSDTSLLKERLVALRTRGFLRLYQSGKVIDFSQPEAVLEVNFAEPVFVVIDRIAVDSEVRSRLVDAIEQGYREAGEVIFEMAPRDDEPVQRWRFSQRFECKNDGTRYDEPEPRLFSFNNPYGACPKCQGFGNTIDFDLNLVIPDKTLTLSDGAIDPWTKPKYKSLATEMKRYSRAAGVPLDVPWQDLTPEQQNLVLKGDGKWWGLRGFFDYLERKKYKLHVRVFLSRYRGYSVCPDCGGLRLRKEARQVKVGGKDISQVSAMTVEEATRFFAELQLTREEADIAERLLVEIRDRLRFMNDVGLEYLSLDRLASTLSGGEAQRIQLATSLGSRLVGTLYVLDEPSIGLHSRDTERLIKILHNLRDLGNTVLVVEHDGEIMRNADHIVDLGPGAGENGGKVIATGSYDEIVGNPASLTGKYLNHELRIQMPAACRTGSGRSIKLVGARAHNLKKVDVTIPLGMLVAITGVSGSGKSTLVHDVLYNALAAEKGQVSGGPRAEVDEVDGADWIDEVVLVDQSPIGRTPRSNPVTYIKAFDAIRELFAAQAESQKRGFTAGHFSFNIPGGRCDVCQGDGTVTVEMQFLADVELICEECKGMRYKPEV
ncbi:MAG TPA: ATP-binding cassette domain-containing protein, partial [Candidatus Methylomirabilis sp.]|nr:ATP-binding cassette domain-containing protein [Candidatus Methylomirabilis sp.]